MTEADENHPTVDESASSVYQRNGRLRSRRRGLLKTSLIGMAHVPAALAPNVTVEHYIGRASCGSMLPIALAAAIFWGAVGLLAI